MNFIAGKFRGIMEAKNSSN